MRFSIRDLLISTALIAAGLAGFRLLWTADITHKALPNAVTLAVWFGSGACIGAGILRPLTGHWWLGAVFGSVIQLIFYAFSTPVIPAN
jgi:hypothetical protein